MGYDGRVRFNELIPILQVAIGPVILISGAGLLLLSMTNRYGRVIDRARLLSDALRTRQQQQQQQPGGAVPNGAVANRSAADTGQFALQLEILTRRARLVRLCITLAVVSVLLASVMIIVLFLAALLHLDAAVLIVLLFTACMGSLIASLVVFLRDINLSLSALELQIQSGATPMTAS